MKSGDQLIRCRCESSHTLVFLSVLWQHHFPKNYNDDLAPVQVGQHLSLHMDQSLRVYGNSMSGGTAPGGISFGEKKAVEDEGWRDGTV